jgi:hypothetical protein
VLSVIGISWVRFPATPLVAIQQPASSLEESLMSRLSLVFVYDQYLCCNLVEAIAIVAEYVVDVLKAAVQKKLARRNEIYLHHLMGDHHDILPYCIDRRDWHRYNIMNDFF